MTDNPVYAVTQVVGTSDKGVGDAIQNAVTTASKSLRNISWFEVEEVRGHIDNAKVSSYQVALKLGFRYTSK